MVAFYLFRIKKLQPFFIYDIFTVIEFCLFTWYFYSIIFNVRIKKSIPFITAGFLLFCISFYLFYGNNASYSSILAGVEAVLIIAMCIYYFLDQLKQPNTLMIYSSINFWIIISFLIYLSGTFFLNIYADSMISDKTFVKQYIIINSSFNILKNILLSVAMLMKPEKINKEKKFPDDMLNADLSDSLKIN